MRARDRRGERSASCHSNGLNSLKDLLLVGQIIAEAHRVLALKLQPPGYVLGPMSWELSRACYTSEGLVPPHSSRSCTDRS